MPILGPVEELVEVGRLARVNKPAQPTGFSVSRSGPALTLSWTDPSDSTITKYQCRHRRRPSGGGGFTAFSAWIDVPDSDATTTRGTRSPPVPGTVTRYGP